MKKVLLRLLKNPSLLTVFSQGLAVVQRAGALLSAKVTRTVSLCYWLHPDLFHSPGNQFNILGYIITWYKLS